MSDTWGLIARIGNEKARLKELELGEEYMKGLTVMDIASLNAISQSPTMLVTSNLSCISEYFLMVPFMKPTTFWVGCRNFLSDRPFLFCGP